MRKARLQIEALEARDVPSISAIPTLKVDWFSAAASTAECGETSSAYLKTPGNDVGRAGGCADDHGPAGDGRAFDEGGVGARLNAITTPGDQASLAGPL